MNRKKSLQEIIYAVFLLVDMILLFFWFTARNSGRIEERNRDYAADSARMKSEQIDAILFTDFNGVDYVSGESICFCSDISLKCYTAHDCRRKLLLGE